MLMCFTILLMRLLQHFVLYICIEFMSFARFHNSFVFVLVFFFGFYYVSFHFVSLFCVTFFCYWILQSKIIFWCLFFLFFLLLFSISIFFLFFYCIGFRCNGSYARQRHHCRRLFSGIDDTNIGLNKRKIKHESIRINSKPTQIQFNFLILNNFHKDTHLQWNEFDYMKKKIKCNNEID